MGIDPGKKGAVAVLFENGRSTVVDCPKDVAGMAEVIHNILGEGIPSMTALEKVASMPGQGVKSMFSFGENFGAWQGILASNRIPHILPRPQAWMKGLIPPKSDKHMHVAVARQQFPDQQFAGPRGGMKDGWADALLLARYAKRYEGDM